MNVRSLVVAATAFAVAGGCVPSLHPFYTPETMVYREALLGTWVNPSDNETWSFVSENDGQYVLTFTDSEGLTGEFEVHLVTMGDHLFLDFYPEPPEVESNEFYLGHLLAIHTLARLEMSDSGLTVAGMNPEWMEEYLDLHPEALAAERLDNTLVLTAATSELQRFVLEHMDEGELFISEADRLVRPE
jgi:hypothetical protein